MSTKTLIENILKISASLWDVPNGEYKKPIETQLPILQVDTIKCTVRIAVSKSHMYLRIQSNKICDLFEDDMMSYASTTLAFKYPHMEEATVLKGLVELKKYLKTLKFEKYTGRLVASEGGERYEIESWLDFVKDIENIKTQGCEDCCVCKDKTLTTTLCGHTLCYECWEQIREDEDDCMLCPLCREIINCTDSTNDANKDA